MPPLSRLRTPALVRLAEELRFAPRGVILRDIERAEELAGDVEAEGRYPVEWVVFRVSGYRPEVAREEPVEGGDLLGDLSSLVERLCAQAGLREGEAGELLSIEALCARWGVSRSTIGRYRRRGLVARRVIGPDGRTRLGFRPEVIERHEARRGAELSRAASYTRVGEGTRAEIVRRAGRYREWAGLSLNEAALRLAKRYGRSHEAVRQILRGHDARAREPIFGGEGPLPERRRRSIERALRRGIEPARIAERFGRSASLVRRVAGDVRAERLRALMSEEVIPRVGEGEGDESILCAPDVSSGLSWGWESDLGALVHAARELPPPRIEREVAMALAYRALCARARSVAGSLAERGASPSAVDRAETDLRWAGLLKLGLLREQLGTVLRAIEDRADCAAERLGSTALGELVLCGILAAGGAIDRHRPRRGGRLAGAISVSADRALARHPAMAGAPGRARGRAEAILTTRSLGDWRGDVVRWMRAVGPDARVLRAGAWEHVPHGEVLRERYALGGGMPRTLEEVARERGLGAMHVARREREALRAALARAREPEEENAPPGGRPGGARAGSG